MNDFLKAVVYGGLFLVPFLTLYVANDYFFPFITGKNFWFRIVIEIVFVAWAVLCLIDVKYRPKFSWILTSFSVFLVVMFFANLFGIHPDSSFWSNFERMDGYVTIVHIYLYAFVLGSVITNKKAWGWYLNATLLAAFITALYGIAQYTGMTGEREANRIESYLGNSAYFSIYMFFHIFIAFWMFVESKVTLHRVIYALLSVMFIFSLMNSGTRGTVLGFAAGVGVMVTYIILFGAKYKEFRRYAIGFFILIAIGASALVLGRESDFVKNNGNLNRIAHINLSADLEVRGTIWGMAWEGVKERPLLGWGQGNFNYVFNAKYDPFLYNQEQWFDRAHNIVMDWLIAGGFLGLMSYLSIFGACIYYLLVVPFIKKDEETFSVLERGVLLGILVGYMTHNLVVFDNIVSYMFFALILALLHSRVAQSIASVEKFKVDRKLVSGFVAPVAIVFMIAVVYTINVPGLGAVTDIIDGYRSASWEDRYEAFARAVSRNSFAYQEVTEQIAQQAMNIAYDPNVPPEVKQKFMALAETELKSLIERKPGDSRIYVFAGSFYRAMGNLDEAERQMDEARKFSPNKQSIISQQGIVAYSQGNIPKARDYFKEAFELDKRNMEAREYYVAMLFANKEGEAAKALIENDEQREKLAMNDFLLSVANEAGDKEFLIDAYKVRIEKQPTLEQNWMSLAFLYNETGQKDLAANTLREAAIAKPSFAKMANCVANNIEAGRKPEQGCQASTTAPVLAPVKN